MGKNVAVFVDVANIFYAAKAAGVDIDYVTLLKSAIAGRDFVRAYAYTGLDPDNENQRNFHSFLARNGYKVVSKDIRKYGDGKVKANLDIELVVDMMKTARNLDVAIVVSGDGDFAPAIRAVQEMGVRCEVISFRGNTSSDLIEVADQFTDIVQMAKVERGSSRSGRRVAGDDEDLSMTEVPDKQTEGTGAGRSRGRGRTRTRTGEPEPVAAASGRSEGRAPARGRRVAATADAGIAAAAVGEPAVAITAGGLPLVVMPGEKLSRVARAGAPATAPAIVPDDDEAVGAGPEPGGEAPLEGEAPRRRRRRGGRGRGRGRGREELVAEGAPSEPRPEVARRFEEEDEIPSAPRGPRPTPFGSVWDSQIGMDRPAANLSGLSEEEFDDEPAIPEYLIAERRGPAGGQRGGAGGGRGGRSSRSGYSAAVDRERYGRGGGGGINRYPDVSGRVGSPPRGGSGGGGGAGREPGRRDDRGFNRGERVDRPVAGPRSAEGWSEVPPELEAMLRAQLAAKSGGTVRQERPAAQAEAPASESATGSVASSLRPRGRRPGAGAAPAGAAAVADADMAPRRRTTRTKATAAAAAPDDGSGATTPKRRTTRSASATGSAAATAAGNSAEDAAPKRRTTRAKAADGVTSGTASAKDAAPKRRTTRAKKADEA